MTLPLLKENYDILKRLKDAGGTAAFPQTESKRIGMLNDYRYLDRYGVDPVAPITCQITAKGLDYVSAYEKEQEQIAEDRTREDAKENREVRLRKQDVRRSWTQFHLGLVLGAIIGYIIGWVHPLGGVTPSSVWRSMATFFRSLFH